MMEDGVKRDTDKPGGGKSPGKEGWVKKCSRKILVSYKPCYIRLEKSEIAVYENEDLQKCTERVNLENYDKCLELKSAFKKKNRLVLIRAPKCGNKVHDVKLQTQTPEEKEAWIKDLSDAIKRAKNKIFDEVKVDESCSLKHVTRTRPKGNQNRRPPTRIHLKEVANTSLDGIVRLDLDAFDPTSSATHHVNADVSTPSQTVKPPMPPLKSTESIVETPNEEISPQQKVVKPPMPPSTQNKPRLLPTEQLKLEITPTNGKEESKDQISALPSPPSKSSKPPMPPSKDKKPNRVPEEGTNMFTEDKKGEGDEELPTHVLTNNETDKMVVVENFPTAPSENPVKPQVLEDDSLSESTPVPEEQESIPHSITVEVEDNAVPSIMSNGENQKSTSPFSLPPESFPEPVKKITGRPLPPNKRKQRLKAGVGNQVPSANVPPSTEIITISTSDICVSGISHVQNPVKAEDDLMQPSEQNKTNCMSWADKNESAVLCTGTEDVEMKVSESKDLEKLFEMDIALEDIAPQMSPNQLLCDSNTEKSEVDPQTIEVNPTANFINQDKSQEDKRIQILQQSQCGHNKQPTAPLQLLNFSSKGKSASIGELLSESVEESGVLSAEGSFVSYPRSPIGELQSKVALELENTQRLLNTVTPQKDQTEKGPEQCGSLEDCSPSELLATAVEKLKTADQFLREVKSLTLEKKHRRTSC